MSEQGSDLSLERRAPQEELYRQARVAIITAKCAYHFQSPRWLVLLSEAMGVIERCPEAWRRELLRELCAFHPSWKRRPQRLEG